MPSSAATPAAPKVPEIAYKFAAKLVQDGATRIFLSKGDRIYEAKQGEALDEDYRVESVSGERVAIVYLPLGTRQEVPIASSIGSGSAHGPATTAGVPSEAQANARAALQPAGPATVADSKPARLHWEGPKEVEAGSSFEVALRLSSSQPLKASPMRLDFEPDVLQSIGVRAGKFFDQGSFSYRVNPDGSIFVGASGSGAPPGADAELLVLTFRSIKAGATAEVKLASLALQGTTGQPIEHDRISTFRTTIQ